MKIKSSKIITWLVLVISVPLSVPIFAKNRKFITDYSCTLGNDYEFKQCTKKLNALKLRDGPVKIEGELFKIIDEPDALYFEGQFSDTRSSFSHSSELNMFDQLVLSFENTHETQLKYADQFVSFTLTKESDTLWKASVPLKLRSLAKKGKSSLSYDVQIMKVPLQINLTEKEYQQFIDKPLPGVGF